VRVSARLDDFEGRVKGRFGSVRKRLDMRDCPVLGLGLDRDHSLGQSRKAKIQRTPFELMCRPHDAVDIARRGLLTDRCEQLRNLCDKFPKNVHEFRTETIRNHLKLFPINKIELALRGDSIGLHTSKFAQPRLFSRELSSRMPPEQLSIEVFILKGIRRAGQFRRQGKWKRGFNFYADRVMLSAMSDPVVIVGAGAAGLCAAERLAERGMEVVVLEGSTVVGGRVRALEGFAEFPIELGAEELHGPTNAIVRLAVARGVESLRHLSMNDLIRLDGELQPLDQAEHDPAVWRAFEVIDRLGAYAGDNWTVSEFLTRTHFPRRTWHYLDSRLGVEHGTTLDRLAMRGFLHYEKGWEARETNFTLRGRYLDLFAPLIESLRPVTRLGAVVTGIFWDGQPVVHLQEGGTLTARAVIVTASLLVLRDGVIAFDPPLPPEKLAATRAIGMDRGLKIILKFRERFWDERMFFLHSDGFLPQYWATGKGKSDEGRVLTAFVGGSRADTLAQMGVDPVRFAIEELDEIFGSGVASRSFDRGLIADWGAEPLVRGLYSYASTETTEAHREALARPLGGRLFFAGEATDTTGHSGTVHGAMETGWRAAEEVAAALA